MRVDVSKLGPVLHQLDHVLPAEVLPVLEMRIDFADKLQVFCGIERLAILTEVLLSAHRRDSKKIGTLIDYWCHVLPLVALGCNRFCTT